MLLKIRSQPLGGTVERQAEHVPVLLWALSAQLWDALPQTAQHLRLQLNPHRLHTRIPPHSAMTPLSFAPHSLGLALVSWWTEPGSEVAIFWVKAQLMHHPAFGDQIKYITCHYFLGIPCWVRIACTILKNHSIHMCTLCSLENTGQLESK